MKYKLNITVVEPNLSFQEEMDGFKERSKYNNFTDIQLPQQDIIKNVLIVELNEEEYRKVKSEVIKIFN